MNARPSGALRRLGRKVIVFSNWGFEANNTTERVAKALARAGIPTRHASRPFTPWKLPGPRRFWAEPGLECVRPIFFGHRSLKIPLIDRWQERHIIGQLGSGSRGGRYTPVAVFHDPWKFGHEQVVAGLKRAGWRLVHLHLDHGDHLEAAKLADLVLSIAPAETESLRRQLKAPVLQLPQLFDELPLHDRETHAAEAEALLAGIPGAKLVYSGAALRRLDADLVVEILRTEPGWSFVTFGEPPTVARPRNWHVLPWQHPARLAAIVERADVGFLPYRVADPVQYHCVPLKLWDCFAADCPVVMTPIAIASSYGDLVRTGSTRDELRACIREALAETPDASRTARRMKLAQSHSLGELQEWLADCVLGLSVGPAPTPT